MNPTPHTTLLLAALFACSAPASAADSALYRPGQSPVLVPEVMPAPSATREDMAVIDAFRTRYRTAGSPRLAFFWNMQLDDDFRDRNVSTTRIEETGDRSASLRGRVKSGPVNLEARESSTNTVTMTSSQERDLAPIRRRIGLPERDLWKVEGAFTGALREAGVKLIDRTTTMRTVAHEKKLGGNRETETAALLKHADMLLEVLMTGDADSPLGVGFRVSLRDIRTGEEKLSLYSQGLRPDTGTSRVRFEAGPNGYERISETSAHDAREVGRRVATEMMVELLGTL